MPMMEARVAQGVVRGVAVPDATVFRGVPYAAPPVGALRFRAPQPAPAWQGVRAADRFPAACPQLPMPVGSFYEKEFYSTPDRCPRMDEDCLYLNVWTPAENAGERLPVAFWIHGGAFDHGFGHEAEFDGSAFAARGVILVTIQYRVGVFGFFAHPWLSAEDGAGANGNAGLLDQLAALAWVRANIAAFGGDPNRVTVFGQSAGAISAQALVSAPRARGLIAGAIFQSGGGYRTGLRLPTRAEAELAGQAFAAHAGASSLAELRGLPADALLQKASDWAASLPTDALAFSPNVDGALLPAQLDDLAARGDIPDIPYLLGGTKDDLSFDDAGGSLDGACAAWSLLLEQLGRAPAFVYSFRRDLPGGGGAFHSAELWYVFGTLDRCWRPFTEHDRALSREMCGAWCAFIRDGDPAVAGWARCARGAEYVKVFA